MRDEAHELPPSKCFAFVRTFDTKPKRRLFEVLKSQGMQMNQQMTFLSDGGESVRESGVLNPEAEHWLDWFHITMRLTVLGQYTKGVEKQNPELAVKTEKALTRIKHYLWHGNVFQALQIIDPWKAISRMSKSPLERNSKITERRVRIADLHREQSCVHSQLRRRYRNGDTIARPLSNQR